MATKGSCPCSRVCAHVDFNSPLTRHGEIFRFERGEVLWRQGEPSRWLVAVCTGVLKLSREWPDGREVILDLVFRGRMVGETAALKGHREVATCTAIAPGKAVRVPAERVHRLLADEPRLSTILLEMACARLDLFTRRLDEISHGAVENRLARVLLRIGDEVGLKDSRGTFVPVRLSRSDLADMVGCRVETTIRVMTRWQREGIVETQREGIIIRNRDHLLAAAEATG